LASVTVTLSCTEPLEPAENAIEEVPAPDVIVPLVIPQLYAAPAPAEGTEAALPEENGQTEEAAEIAAEGSARTTASVVAGGDWQPLTVAVTLYVPDAEVGADRICGFCWFDVNPPGPVQP